MTPPLSGPPGFNSGVRAPADRGRDGRGREKGPERSEHPRDLGLLPLGRDLPGELCEDLTQLIRVLRGVVRASGPLRNGHERRGVGDTRSSEASEASAAASESAAEDLAAELFARARE